MINKSQTNKIEALQKKCFGMIKTTKPMLLFNQLVILQNFKLGYKLHNRHSHLPNKIREACETDTNSKSLKKKHNYNTRNKDLLKTPKAIGQPYQHSFLVRSIVDYNNLPNEIKGIRCEHSFVTKCKNHLLTAKTRLT